MTSKISRPSALYIPYRMVLPEDFVCPDPEPGPDKMQQMPILEECAHLLRDHFAGQPYVHVGGAGFVYWERGNMNRRVEPDMHIAVGVDAPAIFRRNGYVIWEAGKPPDFALEVASESTHTVDTGRKRQLYADIGVTEYWRFDPTGGEFYGYPLAGESLDNGVYQAILLSAEPDGMTWGYSPTLDLCLCAQGRRLMFYDRKTGRYLQNITEAKASIAEAQAQLDAERAAWQQAAEERTAREEAEAEVERLREQIRRLRGYG